MKIACFLCALVPCFASVSCVTQELTDHSLSDTYAWLDTTPRAHLRDTRPQSTLSQWKTGLPPARIAKADTANVSTASKKRVNKEKVEDSDHSRQNNNSYSYAQGYRTTYTRHSRRHHQHGSKNRGSAAPQRQRFVRTVQKVGPSIVPQLSTPLSTRSYSGGPRILPASGTVIGPVPTPQFRRDAESRARRGESRKVRGRR